MPQIATELLELAVRELFDWGLVKTDPNFANYRYDRENGHIGLLDFGAARHYLKMRTQVLRRLLTAGIERDTAAIEQATADVGDTQPEDPRSYREAVTGLLMDATEPARHLGAYDFATTDLAARMSDKVIAIRFQARY